MTCPIPFETLVAWVAGELPDPDATTVEEHIFSCDACAAAAERITRITGGLRERIPWVISRRQYDRLVDGRTRIRLTQVEPGRMPRARFTPEVDLLVHALRGDFSRADRVDIDVFSPDRTKHVLIEHVPFDPQAGEFQDVAIYWRSDLAPGATIAGPAVIAEDDTSTVVSPLFEAQVDKFGYIALTRREV